MSLCRLCSKRFLHRTSVVGLRVPDEMIIHPKHRTYKETEFPKGSAPEKLANIVTNLGGRQPRPIVPVQYLFKGDFVYINEGDDTGKRGVVIQVLQKESEVYVQGRNCKWVKDLGNTYKKVERPLLMHQVSLIDPQYRLPTSIEFRYSEFGELVRVSKKSGRIIPYPEVTSAAPNEDGHKDTSKALVEKQTFNMPLSTFEDEILESMNLGDEIEANKNKYQTWLY